MNMTLDENIPSNACISNSWDLIGRFLPRIWTFYGFNRRKRICRWSGWTFFPLGEVENFFVRSKRKAAIFWMISALSRKLLSEVEESNIMIDAFFRNNEDMFKTHRQVTRASCRKRWHFACWNVVQNRLCRYRNSYGNFFPKKIIQCMSSDVSLWKRKENASRLMCIASRWSLLRMRPLIRVHNGRDIDIVSRCFQ
jgi:hypothetical protein